MSKIIKSSGSIEFETDSGYESTESWPSMDGNKVLIQMIDELGRVLTINGDADLARSTLEEAINRTQADLAA
jgi:histidinol phosphatase-like PHP family hydrolase